MVHGLGVCLGDPVLSSRLGHRSAANMGASEN